MALTQHGVKPELHMMTLEYLSSRLAIQRTAFTYFSVGPVLQRTSSD